MRFAATLIWLVLLLSACATEHPQPDTLPPFPTVIEKAAPQVTPPVGAISVPLPERMPVDARPVTKPPSLRAPPGSPELSKRVHLPAWASACKGASETACHGYTNCTWVKAYVKKSGAPVNAYCRTR